MDRWTLVVGTTMLAACGGTSGDVAAAPDAAREEEVVAPAPPKAAESASSSLVIGQWNLEFFGSPTSGPPDDALQVQNARKVIEHLDPDVIGLEEIMDDARWAELKKLLPAYDGIMVSEAAVAGGPAAYASIPSRLAVLFKRSRMTLSSAKALPAIDPGRAPLEVVLKADINGTKTNLVFMVVHFYPFAEAASWDRRKASGDELKRHLDTTHPNALVAVVGDFNDDVDTSIVEGRATPFAQLRDDADHYRFTTQGLSVAQQATTTAFPSTIDHHLVTNELAQAFVPRSAWVERPSYIADYRATTSDHYPVITRYQFPR